MKFIISFFFIIILHSPFSILHSQSTAVASLDTIYTTNLHYGDTIIMPVRAKKFIDIGSIGYWISYDSKVLTFDTLIDRLSQLNSMSYNNNDNMLKIGWYNAGNSGINFANITLFKLKFIYKGGSGKISYYLPMCHVGSYSTHTYLNVKFLDGAVLCKPFLFDLTNPLKNNFTDSTPYFQWKSSFLALYYKLFIDGKLYKDSIYSTSWHYNNTKSLSSGSHSWFVIAFNVTDYTMSNTVENFYVDKTSPNVFNLISPANDSVINSYKLTFNWLRSGDSESGLSGYQFCLKGFPVINLSPQDTFISNIPFFTSGSYSWFVKAIDNVGNEVVSRIDTFTIKPEKPDSVTGIVTYNNSLNSVLYNIKIILKTTENIKIDSTMTNSKGYFVFRNLLNGNYIIDAKTDIPPVGINPVDAFMVNRKYIKLYDFADPIREICADVNRDGKINPIDALLINRFYIKSISSFKNGNWYFEQVKFSVNSDNPVLNIKGMSLGDVNASFKPQE